MMNLMKKMYDEGDDEMKRTIAKTWTESKDGKKWIIYYKFMKILEIS